MSRWLALVSILSMVCSQGCTMCANPHDCKYAAYGGTRPRADQVHGRVGSILDPAAEITVAQREEAPEPTPAHATELSDDVSASPLEPVPVKATTESNLVVVSDVAESSNGVQPFESQEFDPFGPGDVAPSDPMPAVDTPSVDQESAPEEPKMVLVLDAEPLANQAATPESVADEDPSPMAEESTPPSTLRLLDASGQELPISEQR